MRTYAKDGSINETLILTTIDKHYFKDLDENWKRHIKRMFKTVKDDDYIRANYYEYKDAKPDIVISINNRKILLSIKSGRSPCMHQEPIYTFFEFLRKNDVPQRIIKIIAFYHYGYSLTKRVSDHVLSREEIIATYPKEIQEVNDYFNKHTSIIIEIIYRSIIKGRLDRDLIDYLYYGNANKGFLLSISDIIRLIISVPVNIDQTLAFRQLTYISCARKPDNPKRHNLKIHWPILCKWFYEPEFMKKYG